MDSTKPFKSTAENNAVEAQAFPEIGKLNLSYIRRGIEDVLKLVGRDGIFDEYTLHDITHVDAMLQSFDFLIPSTTSTIMTPAEWLLITLASYFHDLGLLVTKDEFALRNKSGFLHFRDDFLLKGDEGADYADALAALSDEQRERFYYQEFVRLHHGERVEHWIMGRTRQELGITHQAVQTVEDLLGGLDAKFREDLALICRSHQQANLDNIDHVYVVRRAYGQPTPTHANLQYIAILLRSADLLQIQRRRVPSIVYKLIDPANPKSQEEWAKQAKVRAVLPARSAEAPDGVLDTIEVQAVFDEASGFFGLDSYLQYARTELKRCFDWAELARKRGAKHDFPWRFINDDQVEARGFLPQRYQFELDRHKILDLLTGHTLYNDSRVAVREILQNSIDTVRLRHFSGKAATIGCVHVSWTSATRELVVRDEGEGMTREIIEKHLLNVGSSYYQDRGFKERYPEFSPISKFGIGVLSYFMISNDVTIRTVSEDDPIAHEISLPSATQRYLIKTIPKDALSIKRLGNHGTEVCLRLRSSVKLGDIEKLLRYWIVVPECRVLLSIDDGSPISIGEASVHDALENYIRRALSGDRKREREFKIKEAEPADVMQLAYGIEYSPWFKVWELMTRPSEEELGYLEIGERESELDSPAGICVEGIRVSSQPLGYNDEGVFALVNLTGRGSPRTNVARYDIEQTEELRSAISLAYRIIGRHITDEYARIEAAGMGLAKAALEADLMMDRLVQDSKEPELVKQCCDDLRIFTIEELGGKRAVSRGELRAFGSVWTVDDPGIGHVDGLCESWDIRRSSGEILCALVEGETPRIPYPRIIGNRMTPLLDFEISEISIDRERPRVDLKWERKAGRWHAPSEEFLLNLERYSPFRHGQMLGVLLFATADVKCNIQYLQLLYTRGYCLNFHNSPLTKLYNTFRNEQQCLNWMLQILRYGYIEENDLPLLRHHLRARKMEEEEFIKAMVLPPENRFRLTDFVRGGSD